MANNSPRTTISLSPFNTKRIREFIIKQKPILGPRINSSILIEEAINIAWPDLEKKYMDKCFEMENGRKKSRV